MKLDILFENDNFIAINKPSGLLSVPDRKQSEPSLKDILLEKYGSIFIVHRLDKATSGVIVFAKNAETHRQLSLLFEERKTEKYYLGIVHGIPEPNEGTIEAPIMIHPGNDAIRIIHQKGKPSTTIYKVVEKLKHFAFVEFQILTGRTHQIRVHCKHIGNSIVCDGVYGQSEQLMLSSIKKKFKLAKSADEELPLLNRLALHSWKLNFTIDEEAFQFEAPLPKDLRATLQQLRKNS